MSLLRMLARDRRVLLLALLAVLTLVLGRHTLGSRTAVTTVVSGGYWVLLFVLGYFVYAVSRVLRANWRNIRFVRADAGVLCLIVVTGGILLAHERYGFKILADELLLVGTSMDMHYDRSAAYPVRATNVQGPFQILDSVIDKRPILFPFVVSLAHDVTGYRPENAFYVNTVLGFVFLTLVYLLGLNIGRSRWAGVLLVLLFGGLPMLAQQMKGGGFELLNLVIISALLLLAIAFAERRDTATLEALCYAAVLVAYTRYESILLIVPVAGIVLWAWWREQRVTLTWPVVITPCFLLLPILQNRVFELRPGVWELASRGATTPFGLQYVANNLGHAAAFFFDTTGYEPNSPLFAAVGLLAAAFFLLWIIRILRNPATSEPGEIATAWIGLGLFGIWALLMAYFWGQFDDPVIHRLSLPVHLLMAIAIAAVGASLWRSARPWQAAAAITVASLVVYSLPAMSRGAYDATYSPSAEMDWRSEFLRRYPEKDYLFVDNDAIFWITHRISATPNTQARARKDGLIFHLRNDTFSAMYVMQHFRIDPETGKRTMVPSDDLGPDFELEPFWERRIQMLFIGRISRIKAIHEDGKIAAQAGPVITPPGAKPPPRSIKEWDKAKSEFTEKWLKDLP